MPFPLVVGGSTRGASGRWIVMMRVEEVRLPAYHSWLALRVERQPTETLREYRERRATIEKIVAGFRWGRFSGTEADEMEGLLQDLLTSSPAPPR